MKKALMVIVVCFVVCGCTHFIGIMSNANYYKTLLLKATASMYNAELACYQLSGAVETKNFIVYDNDVKDWGLNNEDLNQNLQSVLYLYDKRIYSKYVKGALKIKIWEIAQAKAQHNNTQQVKQCLKRLDEPKQKLRARCNNLNTENKLTNLGAFNCFKEMDKVFTDFINEISPKTKNITFTCSQSDEVLAKFGPKFDADIATYALDTIQFKPLVSKELSQDVAKNIAQELDKNLFKDIDKKATAQFIKEKSDDLKKEVFCAYKMRYYGGDLRDLAMFQQSGIFADDIARGYNSFKKAIVEENNENSNAAVILSETRSNYRIKDDKTNRIRSNYRFKDNMSPGKISKELVRVREEIKDKQNKYKAYSKQQRKEQNQKINKEIAELVIEKKKLEAMLKFIKEQ